MNTLQALEWIENGRFDLINGIFPKTFSFFIDLLKMFIGPAPMLTRGWYEAIRLSITHFEQTTGRNIIRGRFPEAAI
ncbi:MAG: hypothetical protein ACKVT0_18605 [Planctomycetaceae bacterium]